MISEITFKPPRVETETALGQARGILFIMGGDENRPVLEEGCQFGTQDASILRVQVRQRFIEQEDLRFRRQRPCQRHALLLASGKGPRSPVRPRLQVEPLQDFIHAPVTSPVVPTRVMQDQFDLTAHRYVRPEGKRLEDHADDARCLDRPGIRPVQPGDESQERGLAGTGRAEKGCGLSRLESKGDTCHGVRDTMMLMDIP